jgi:hypothetical protein
MSPPRSAPFHSPDDAQAAAERYFASPRGKLSLWAGVLGGAFAWALQLQAGYALSRFSYDHPRLTLAHHASSAIALALALAAMLLAWRDWRRIGGGEPAGAEPGVAGRTRFLAALGVLTSGFFALVILAQWIPTFFIHPAWY